MLKRYLNSHINTVPYATCCTVSVLLSFVKLILSSLMQYSDLTDMLQSEFKWNEQNSVSSFEDLFSQQHHGPTFFEQPLTIGEVDGFHQQFGEEEKDGGEDTKRKRKLKMSKQEKIKEEIHLLELQIVQLRICLTSAISTDEHRVELEEKIRQKCELEKTLKKMVLNQIRQKRHREKKRLRQQEESSTLDSLTNFLPHDQHHI